MQCIAMTCNAMQRNAMKWNSVQGGWVERVQRCNEALSYFGGLGGWLRLSGSGGCFLLVPKLRLGNVFREALLRGVRACTGSASLHFRVCMRVCVKLAGAMQRIRETPLDPSPPNGAAKSPKCEYFSSNRPLTPIHLAGGGGGAMRKCLTSVPFWPSANCLPWRKGSCGVRGWHARRVNSESTKTWQGLTRPNPNPLPFLLFQPLAVAS